MAIKLIGNYAKRVGLPGYSSHQFSVSVETELTDSGDIQGEATRIYQLLQDAVDREIQETGFVPGDEYGLATNSHTNGNGNGSHHPNGNGSNGHRRDTWNCSSKQRSLIEKLVDENQLDRNEVEEIAQDRFGCGVKLLNRLQASGLIAELLEITGKNKSNGHRNGSYRKGGSR